MLKNQLAETGIIRKNFAILKPNSMSKLNYNSILLELSIQNCERKKYELAMCLRWTK